MKIEEIYLIIPDKDGWRRLPNGNNVTLGNWVILGNDVKLGNDVTLGNRVTLGNDVKLGNDVTLGYGVTLGNDVTLGNWVTLGNRVTLGNDVKLGNGVKLRNWVTLGNGMKLGDGVTFDETPLQIQCHPYLVYPFSKTEIGVGCVIHEIDYWLKSGIPEELAAHPECLLWDAYKKAIIMLAEWMGHPAPYKRALTIHKEIII
jgi:acyl-[acyl carrier protein]--UDP-N-acetylglucosamine O-acyltransferase